MARLGWLHLSDLKLGVRSSRLLQPAYRDAFEQDLRKLHARSGPWDMVLISGDLTLTGSEREFALLDSTLGSLWKFLNGLGSNPCLLAVPGNHDFLRSKVSRSGPSPKNWKAAEVRQGFQAAATNRRRQDVLEGLAPFSEWFETWRRLHPSSALQAFRRGLLPGDFAATVASERMSVGVMGLNSLFRNASGGSLEGAHEVDIEQLAAANPRISRWAHAHDFVMLLTHHAPFSLHPEPLEQLMRAVIRPRGFMLHLCGGHEGGIVAVPEMRSFVLSAPSLFGEEEEDGEQVPMGYSAGYVDTASSIQKGWLHFFPRKATSTKLGAVALLPDIPLALDTRLVLEEDGSIAFPLAAMTKERDPGPGLSELSLPAPEVNRGAPPPPVLARVIESSPPKVFTADLRVVERTTAPSPALPSGLKLREVLGTGNAQVGWAAWSPSGDALGVGLTDGRLVYWNPGEAVPRWAVHAHRKEIVDVCFSPDGKALASRSAASVGVWSVDGTRIETRQRLEGRGRLVAWSSSGLLATESGPAGIQLWRTADWVAAEVGPIRLSGSGTYCLSWSPDGRRLAFSEESDVLSLWDAQAGENGRAVVEEQPVGFRGAILAIAWMPDAPLVALGCRDGVLRIWDTGAARLVTALEGHTDAITGVSFSSDSRLLASMSIDGTVRLFRADTWEEVGRLDEPVTHTTFAGLAFSPTQPVLATLSPGSRGVRLWDIDMEALLSARVPSTTVQAVSAKVVLVGEARAGKSSLALRLARDRFEELSATHGMQFWSIPVNHPRGGDGTAANSLRELILWDMAGQSEYQLVPQLFLRDSTVALMVMEPGRGRPALDEVEGWNQRLLAQTRERPVRKLLVGTKLDDAHAPVDGGAIDHLMKRLQLTAYVSTSARTGQGVAELKAALTQAVDWEALEKIRRPELFQRIRQHLQRLREARRVVLTFSELEAELRRETRGEVDPDALRFVVEQLALQGLVADTRMAEGTRALILEIEQVARYAGSIILAARQNPHGVPALEMAKVMSPTMDFPRIRAEERLHRDQERIVLECVIQLLLEHGICLRHEGLLVFPALFQPTQSEPASESSHTLSVRYDFSGSIDSIYASLVSALAMSQGFGTMRLWNDRAEFGRAGESTSGVRRIQGAGQSARGQARLEVYFDASTPQDTRDVFESFVEKHLREHGVELVEQQVLACGSCGRLFDEESLQLRLAAGRADILCQICETRTPLKLGAQQARKQTPEVAERLQALRTRHQQKLSQSIVATKVESIEEARKVEPIQDMPIRILHLSDLHVGKGDDPLSLLQPLEDDLNDSEDGLGVTRLDYLVISGDITNRATPEEFERAREFVSQLIAKFGVTAERCIIVPGNHDLNWDAEVYTPTKKRNLKEQLVEGRYHREGDLYLIRHESRYPERFKNFSDHFYHPLLQKEYPLHPEQQCLPFLFSETRLQFLAMNSAWEIDEYFQDRSSISERALSRGLADANQQLDEAHKAGTLARDARVLRICVWHHPISGNEKIQADAFMGRLLKANVQICMHGHVHEERADLLRYPQSDKKIHVVGAGSFGAPTADRPESVPRLYNLLEVERDLSGFRVHTRSMRKQGGAWQGWPAWKGEGKGEMRTYYEEKVR